MNSYRLTERAEEDVLDIFLYGIERFGPLQARRYKDELARCFAKLADNPRMGRLAKAIGPDIRRHEHQSHVILYEAEADGVLILALVHGRNVRNLKV